MLGTCPSRYSTRDTYQLMFVALISMPSLQLLQAFLEAAELPLTLRENILETETKLFLSLSALLDQPTACSFIRVNQIC